MEEFKKSSACTRKEKIILASAGLVMAVTIVTAGLWVYKKLAPPREEKKISIVNIADESTVGQKNEEAQKQEEQETQEPSREAVGEEAISPENVDIKVLNGGTLAGAAGKVKDALVPEGYTKTEATNTKLSNYKGVIIYYEPKFQDQIRSIKEILKSKYPVIETKEGMNNGEMTGDIVIILGG